MFLSLINSTVNLNFFIPDFFSAYLRALRAIDNEIWLDFLKDYGDYYQKMVSSQNCQNPMLWHSQTQLTVIILKCNWAMGTMAGCPPIVAIEKLWLEKISPEALTIKAIFVAFLWISWLKHVQIHKITALFIYNAYPIIY